jgi:hypothetical protein
MEEDINMPKFNVEDYEMVKDRIPLFLEKYPEGRINTEVISENNGVTMKAYLYKSLEEQVSCAPLSTGIAREVPGGFIDKYYENCETSAIGRALANINLYSGDRPSYEEMNSAKSMKETKSTTTSSSKPTSPPKLNNPSGSPSVKQTVWIKAFVDAGILAKEDYFDENNQILLTSSGASETMDVVFNQGSWNNFQKDNPEKAKEIADKHDLYKK